MVKRTVVKGTKAPVGLGGRPPTTAGILGWPTGAFVYISRGSAGGNHIAVDISCVTGTNVFAAASGTVVQSVWSTYGYGYYIEIDHGIVDGVPLRTLYAHHSDNLVEVGQYVEKGQLIAYSGSTGNSTGPHLHFEVRVNGERTPPEPWLG
ncbi:MAG: M23 family metallopeptidase, partial [Oscillospiraceae bacterium]|nr:M23 family metallopeptidase [Oscillospiraceae bacterium]